jgi:hypothetical protein
MRSIEVALAADYVRRGMLIIPVILLTITALPMWLFAAFSRDGVLAPAAHEAVALHVTLTLVMGFGAAIAVFQSLGKQSRHFIRPISAARLVGCQMTFGVVTIAGMYLIAAATLNLGGAGWPLMGPALFLAATLACSLAAIWTLEGAVLGQLLGCLAVTMPLTFWFSRCYGAQSFGDWKQMWLNPTAGEALLLGGLAMAAYGVAIVGVSRVRRGDVWDFAALRQWWDRQFAGQMIAKSFANPQSAQVWFEWRQKMTPVPAILIGSFLLLMVALTTFGLMQAGELLEVARTLPLVVLMLVMPMIFGLVAGNCGLESGKTGLRFVLGTRPVTDTFLAMAMLRNCAVGLLLSWGTWLSGFAVIASMMVWMRWTGSGNVLQIVWPEGSTLQNHVAIGCVVVLISWTFTSLMATLVAAGRPWVIVCLLTLMFGLLLMFALLKQWLAESLFEPLLTGWYLVSGILFLGLTVAMFIAAVRQGLIGAMVVVPCLALWLAMTGIATYGSWPSSFYQPTFLCQCIGFFSLSVLPFAGMPLAVRWNRHR